MPFCTHIIGYMFLKLGDVVGDIIDDVHVQLIRCGVEGFGKRLMTMEEIKTRHDYNKDQSSTKCKNAT